MTEERTCRCKGQFAMHKPALHADRDGSEARAQLEREHERGLAAYVPEDEADEVARLRDEVARLSAEATRDYADGYDQGCADARNERSRYVERIEAALTRVDEALSRYPKACGEHPDDDPISCGWKRAVLDVQAALVAPEAAS